MEGSQAEQIRRLHAAAFPHLPQAAVAKRPVQSRTPGHLDRQRAADRQLGSVAAWQGWLRALTGFSSPGYVGGE